MNSVAYCGWKPQTGRTPGAADAPPGVLFVFKTPFFTKKIQKQVILSYKNALFSPSTQIKEIPYKNS